MKQPFCFAGVALIVAALGAQWSQVNRYGRQYSSFRILNTISGVVSAARLNGIGTSSLYRLWLLRELSFERAESLLFASQRKVNPETGSFTTITP